MGSSISGGVTVGKRLGQPLGSLLLTEGDCEGVDVGQSLAEGDSLGMELESNDIEGLLEGMDVGQLLAEGCFEGWPDVGGGTGQMAKI